MLHYNYWSAWGRLLSRGLQFCIFGHYTSGSQRLVQLLLSPQLSSIAWWCLWSPGIRVPNSTQNVIGWQRLDNLTTSVCMGEMRTRVLTKLFHQCRTKAHPAQIGQPCNSVIWLVSIGFLQHMMEDFMVATNHYINLTFPRYILKSHMSYVGPLFLQFRPANSWSVASDLVWNISQ